MKPLLHTLPTGGSGHGFSYWASWMGCALQAELKAARAAVQKYDANSGRTVGSILHALLELYYTRGKQHPFDACAVKYTQDSGDVADVDDNARIEAERLFRAYRMRFPPDELGKVLHAEVTVADSPAMDEAVGVSPFTIKPDLVVSLTGLQAKRLRATRGISIKSGRYIVDHKTDAAKWKIMYPRYFHDLRFTAYMVGWNAARPACKVDGLIVNSLVKTTAVNFVTIVIPLPGRTETEALHRFMLDAQRIQAQSLHEPNATRCFDYNEVCPFLADGTCNRS